MSKYWNDFDGNIITDPKKLYHKRENALQCPNCGHWYTHLEKIKSYTSQGRLCAELIFSCEECGHNEPFSLCVHQHEGVTYFTEKPENIDKSSEKEECMMTTGIIEKNNSSYNIYGKIESIVMERVFALENENTQLKNDLAVANAKLNVYERIASISNSKNTLGFGPPIERDGGKE